MRHWTPKEAMKDALAKHPNCSYADWANGLRMVMTHGGPSMQTTVVIMLWRNEDCYMQGDSPKHIVGGYGR